MAVILAIAAFFLDSDLLAKESALVFILDLLFMWFFRDPERTASGTDDDIVSPADGKVVYIRGNTACIFMNFHNVHVNRAPVSGKIVNMHHTDGGYLPAFSKDSLSNERNTICIESDYGLLEMIQIAGAVTRRIDTYFNVGDKVVRGERIGMIRFGSRVDITPPEGYALTVKIGDRVKAAKSIVARKKDKTSGIVREKPGVNSLNDSIFRLIKLQDIVTLVNALLGFTAILMVIRHPSNAYNASILIVIAVILDGLDGAIARRLEYGVLGEQLDSLADMISFGVAPAVIAYSLLEAQYHYLICIVGGTFLACGILRLARFNAINYKSGFHGLPITTSGLAVPLFILTFRNFQSFPYGLMALMLLLAGLMVSRIPYVKIRDFRVLGVILVFLLIMIAVFYLGMSDQTQSIAGINFMLIGLYILSPVMKLKKIIRK